MNRDTAVAEQLAALGLAFLMSADNIKALVDYVEDTGAAEERKLAANIKETLYSPVKVEYIDSTPEAEELVLAYKDLLEEA